MEIGALIGMALWALIPAFIAKRKDRSFWGYYFLSFLISPFITTIITLCVSNKRREYYPTESIFVEDYSGYQGKMQLKDRDIYNTPVSDSQWLCSCGRVHPKYETSCVCGKSKFDNLNSPKTEGTSSETAEKPATGNQILFCRKCGEKLMEDSKFCGRCGTKIEKE